MELLMVANKQTLNMTDATGTSRSDNSAKKNSSIMRNGMKFIHSDKIKESISKGFLRVEISCKSKKACRRSNLRTNQVVTD